MGLAPFGTFQLCLFHYIYTTIYIYDHICLGPWAHGPGPLWYISITYYWIVGTEVQLFGSMDAGAFCT